MLQELPLVCIRASVASSLPLLKFKTFLEVLTTIRLISWLQTGLWGSYWVPWYSRLLCTAWMPQAKGSIERTAQVSTGTWISGNFGYFRLNPSWEAWLAAEQGLCAANNFTSKPAVQWLSMDITGECFLHSPTAVQSVLLISFYPSNGINCWESRHELQVWLSYWWAPWRGVSSLQPYPWKLLCQIIEAIWSSLSTLFSCTTSLGRVWRAEPCVCSCIWVTELCKGWSRLCHSISALPIQKGVLVLPKGLTKWKEVVGGWSMHCTWLSWVFGDIDAPPRAFSQPPHRLALLGMRAWWTQNWGMCGGTIHEGMGTEGQNHKDILLGKLPHVFASCTRIFEINI